MQICSWVNKSSQQLRLSRGAYSRASAREPGAVRKPGMLEHQEAEEEYNTADVVYDTDHVQPELVGVPR